ncbi:MAG: type II toxin-antitoxin system RelE/ParE family toxin [Phenylobacterium sp.]|nr:type II toxin-antitoxin system RelE/ParE family toxin [Phenylobacterium sp.]
MIEVRQTDVFADWLASLRDRRGAQRIRDRIVRIAGGLVGDVEPVGEGVSEARIHWGPGYRLYFVRRGELLIVLLCGGDKASQARDIVRAKRLAKEV